MGGLLFNGVTTNQWNVVTWFLFGLIYIVIYLY